MSDTSTTKKTWTEDDVRGLLQRNDTAIERAMAALLRRQTADERAAQDTRHTNQRGFSCAHARRGTYYGNWVNSGRKLTGHHLALARSIALRYVRQLVEEANT